MTIRNTFSAGVQNALGSVINGLDDPRVRTATLYLSDRLAVRATRRTALSGRVSRVEFVVTIGRPNYDGRAYLRRAKRNGWPFPVWQEQLVPVRKPKAAKSKAKK